MNGSKWFLCGFDSAFLWVRDRNLLLDVFSASGVFMAEVGETRLASIYAKKLCGDASTTESVCFCLLCFLQLGRLAFNEPVWIVMRSKSRPGCEKIQMQLHFET